MSNPFTSINKIKILEYNNRELSESSNLSNVIIKNHWNRMDLVVIQIEEFKLEVTVLAEDLHRAINNSQNAHQN